MKATIMQPRFTDKSYQEYLRERSKPAYMPRATSPNVSIFDSMRSVDNEMCKRVHGGKSIAQMFRDLK